MKNKLIKIIAAGAVALLSCCSSIKSASLGAGATPGKDYVTSLRPSAASRQYFAQIGNKSPIETLTRGSSGRSKSGVRFVANDGILIPAGVIISFTNKGYCLDPKLPAPVADEEYQLVPTTALIPNKLQGIYHNLVRRAAAGDTEVRNNMQALVWALRTAGTEGGYAARLSSAQKRILDRCSSRPGEFEQIHNGGLAASRLVGELWKLADSAIQVDFGGRRWKPSDFSSAGALNNAINSQLSNLISLGTKLPIQRTGFNYGELEPGIYTDIRGAGHLAFTAKIANATNKDFIFYPCNYVGQVGSGSVLSAVSFAASPSYTQRQRVSMGPIVQIEVLELRPTEDNNVQTIENGVCNIKANYEATINNNQLVVKPIIDVLGIENNIEQGAGNIDLGNGLIVNRNIYRESVNRHEETHAMDAETYQFATLYAAYVEGGEIIETKEPKLSKKINALKEARADAAKLNYLVRMLPNQKGGLREFIKKNVAKIKETDITYGGAFSEYADSLFDDNNNLKEGILSEFEKEIIKLEKEAEKRIYEYVKSKLKT